MNKKITIIIVGLIFLIGIAFVGAKLIEEKKIKDIKEIDCNMKYNKEICKDKLKIDIEENQRLKIDLIEDLKTGKEVFKVYAG